MTENKESKVKTDPLFDGHPEKPFQLMTATEKINYLWQLIEFKNAVKDIRFINKKEIRTDG